MNIEDLRWDGLEQVLEYVRYRLGAVGAIGRYKRKLLMQIAPDQDEFLTKLAEIEAEPAARGNQPAPQDQPSLATSPSRRRPDIPNGGEPQRRWVARRAQAARRRLRAVRVI
jgi:hypothetical protein